MPCRDACESNTHEITIVMSSDDHHQQDHDQCSPFCFCACCASNAVITNVDDFQYSETFSLVTITPSERSALLERSYSIWQPPKLV